jgi:nitroimidazol reductase NimA-like FMN-containing flavoprotein (pyridoxamine 5'-phosphate oxidase superfamily)
MLEMEVRIDIKTRKETDEYSIVMFLSESLVLFLQFVFCITYVLEIRYAYTKDKQNELFYNTAMILSIQMVQRFQI